MNHSRKKAPLCLSMGEAKILRQSEAAVKAAAFFDILPHRCYDKGN